MPVVEADTCAEDPVFVGESFAAHLGGWWLGGAACGPAVFMPA